MSDLAIIDYGMGNLQSIVNAVEYLGDCNPVITSDQEVIKGAKSIILPELEHLVMQWTSSIKGIL